MVKQIKNKREEEINSILSGLTTFIGFFIAISIFSGFFLICAAMFFNKVYLLVIVLIIIGINIPISKLGTRADNWRFKE